MSEMDWGRWIEKRVILITSNDFSYKGVVKEVQDVGSGWIFISMIDDKSNKWITFVNKEIKVLKEIEGERRDDSDGNL